MIEKLIALRGIGLLHNAVPQRAVTLKPITAIYAENGRGKSTLASVLRAFSCGDATAINARTTIGGQNGPTVHLRLNGRNYQFRDGQWTASYDKILVFDSEFVDKNVCSGSRIEPAHRENLLEFALGETGVRHKRTIDKIIEKIRHIQNTLRELTAEIARHSGPYQVSEFVQLQPEPDIESRLKELKQRLADAKRVDDFLHRPVPRQLQMPEFDIETVSTILGKSLESVDNDVEEIVKVHIARRLGGHGEQWLREGLAYLRHGDECPFCGQGLHGITLVEAYKVYFNAAYEALKRQIEVALQEVQKTFSHENWSAISEIFQLNELAGRMWSDRFDCNFAKMVDINALRRTWDALRDNAIELLRQKLAAPLRQLHAQELVADVKTKYLEMRKQVDAYNEAIIRVVRDIEALQSSLKVENMDRLENDIECLEAAQRRLLPEVSRVCQRYQRFENAKRLLERCKDELREQLHDYTEQLLATYRDTINNLLDRFGANFSIVEIGVRHTGGRARTEYRLRVLGETIPVVSPGGRSDVPSLVTTLSEGDKRTLALAFFLARVTLEQSMEDCIIVIDDPVSSLDMGRRRATRDALLKVATRCSQLIVLSHDALFLRDALEKIADDGIWTCLQLTRRGDYSVLEGCDIHRICRDDYYRSYELLLNYLTSGPNGNEAEVARTIRIYLEHNLRNRYPVELEGAKNLGKMIERIRNDLSRFGQLAARLDDLVQLNDFCSPFHHGTDDRPPDPTDSELRPMVRLALEIGRGER
ncbi:AAA family ATPase [Thermaerobacter subterraneus]|uniref:Nuclease SbcCD subunit C n=1 Tax=Thermaerobacter subterraneus DSM 13965 TaxID=867903 RepID=K6Q2C4_9FIRM|nr:AAA family ATPase [Thermaerobacter subterraneus]EKP95149.1 hypothetical protein ThesuDRAFT_00879 [Thermaerobacter subterraneus DSM 13965]